MTYPLGSTIYVPSKFSIWRYKTIAATSITPSVTQQIARPRSPANQYPLAALKQRKALVHPLAQAPGLLSIFRSFIGPS